MADTLGELTVRRLGTELATAESLTHQGSYGAAYHAWAEVEILAKLTLTWAQARKAQSKELMHD